jgi:hypothetical protein
MAVSWREVHIPFAAGINTKPGPRALEPPALAVCRNAEFDDVGELRPRKPFRAMPMDILGGGTVGTVRRLAVYQGELLLFSDDGLYSWSERDDAWVFRSVYEAPSTTEATVFTRTSEQTLTDCAVLGGVALYVWLDEGTAAGLYAAALDVDTGAVIQGPTLLPGVDVTRPRLQAMATKFVMTATVSGALNARSIDPSTIAADLAKSWTGIVTTSGYDMTVYDATNVALAIRTAGNTYLIATLSEDVLTFSFVSKARVCDGPISVSVTPATDVVVTRAKGAAIETDVLDSSFADVVINVGAGTALGTPVNQIASASRSVLDGGEYRIYIWYSAQEAITGGFECRANYVDTAGATGTDGTFAHRLGVSSRAWDYGGEVYVWLATGQLNTTNNTYLQNTYFAYRDDGLLTAKAAADVGGGFVPLSGHLPNVQPLTATSYGCALTERRLLVVGQSQQGYAARSPRAVVLTFDDSDARRTAELGKTLYVTGSQVMQYDTQNLVELGFPMFPYVLSVIDPGIAGNLEAGTYSWRPGIRWENAQGEQERSTSATFFDAAIAASRQANISAAPVHVTGKVPGRARSLPAFEIWRTQKDPTVDALQYLVTSRDPTATGPNGYIENDPTLAQFPTYVDDYADATLLQQEQNPENGGRVESLAPPGATIIVADASRLFLAGIPNEPHQIVYSQLRGVGELATFFDAFTIDLPSTGGTITALALLNETLIAFKETAIYAIPGVGFSNTGGGANYGPARLVATDTGAQSQETLAVTPIGLIFRSDKGWYLLDRGFTPRYIGGPVDEFDDDTIVGVEVLEAQHQIRCVSAERILVYDYLVEQWGEWTIGDHVNSVLWNGVHVVASETQVQIQQSDFVRDASTEAPYSIDVETAWIKVADMQGFARIRHAMVLGEYRSPHELRIRMARDYETTFHQLNTWTPDTTTVGAREQVRTSATIQKVESVKLRITSVATGAAPGVLGDVGADLGDDPPDGEALRLSGLAFTVGLKRRLYRQPAANKQ